MADHNILKMGQIVLAVLLLATLATAVLRRLKPGLNLKEVEARIHAWWIMAIVFFVAVEFNDTLSIGFFLVISAVAFREYEKLLHSRPADFNAIALAYVAIPVQYWWLHSGWYTMFLLFIPVYMFLVVPIWLVLSREASGFVASAAAINWGLMAFVFGLSHLSCLVLKPEVPGTDASGRTMILFLVFVVEISDVLQFVWGKTLGRHKLIPTISPNKTWEGLIGGVASTVVLSLALRFLTPFSVSETLWVSLLVTLSGFFGGAVMSAVKRDFGVKDFGHIIPGHGGILDRVDSLVYAAPLFFHVVNYYHY